MTLLQPRVRRLSLADFRSYAQARCDVDGALVVLVGENGAGKTNVLEALSMFSAGRGLRRADLVECARHGGAGGYAVSLELACDDATTQLGHGLGADGERRVSHRTRAGLLGARLRRSFARAVADAGDGRAFRRPRGRPPPLS